MSGTRNKLNGLKDSISRIVLGFILFSLSISGLAFALYLRYLGFSGTIIAGYGFLAEVIAMGLCYFIFKGYLKIDEEIEKPEKKKKK